MSTGLEVADIFRRHGGAYCGTHDGHLGRVERRVMSAIALCRTAALGGHVERCEDCGETRVAYNSCRNRHCPKCQGQARAEWLAARQIELLPAPYFHVVFTLPAPVAAIAFQNKAAVYAILFKAAAETLRVIAADPKHLGAEIGFVAVLHTWGQTLHHHPHVHCVVPGGGLAPACPGPPSERTRWVACRPGFFLPVRVLSRLFRRLFLEERQAALRRPRTGAGLSRPLHAPRRHHQLPPGQPDRWPGQLPLEGLSASRQAEDHHPRRRRVHPTLPAPRPARWLPPHPPLRVPRQRPSCREAGPLPGVAGCVAARRTSCGGSGPARPSASSDRERLPSLPLLRWRHDPACHAAATGAVSPVLLAGHVVTWRHPPSAKHFPTASRAGAHRFARRRTKRSRRRLTRGTRPHTPLPQTRMADRRPGAIPLIPVGSSRRSVPIDVPEKTAQLQSP